MFDKLGKFPLFIKHKKYIVHWWCTLCIFLNPSLITPHNIKVEKKPWNRKKRFQWGLMFVSHFTAGTSFFYHCSSATLLPYCIQQQQKGKPKTMGFSINQGRLIDSLSLIKRASLSFLRIGLMSHGNIIYNITNGESLKDKYYLLAKSKARIGDTTIPTAVTKAKIIYCSVWNVVSMSATCQWQTKMS